MKIPFPSVSSDLAVSSHMYICMKTEKNRCEFVKCQTLKPYMLINDIVKNFCDEKPDITRNPFTRTTRIDCDKIFITSNVNYDEKLLTNLRKNICEELFNEIHEKISAKECEYIELNEEILVLLNTLITFLSEEEVK